MQQAAGLAVMALLCSGGCRSAAPSATGAAGGAQGGQGSRGFEPGPTQCAAGAPTACESMFGDTSSCCSYRENTGAYLCRSGRCEFLVIRAAPRSSCRFELDIDEQPPALNAWLLNVAIDCALVPPRGASHLDPGGGGARAGMTPPADSAAGASDFAGEGGMPPAGAAAGAAGVGLEQPNWTLDDSAWPAAVVVLGGWCDELREGEHRVDIVLQCAVDP